MSNAPEERYRDYNIGKRIADLRNRQGLTQAKLGEQVDRSGPNISQLEAGDVDRSPAQLASLAELLTAHPLYLIAGLGPETCEMVDRMESLNADQRAAASRLFKAVLDLAEAANAWQMAREK